MKSSSLSQDEKKQRVSHLRSILLDLRSDPLIGNTYINEIVLGHLVEGIKKGAILEIHVAIQEVICLIVRGGWDLDQSELQNQLIDYLELLQLFYTHFHVSNPAEIAYIVSSLPQVIDQAGLHATRDFDLTKFLGQVSTPQLHRDDTYLELMRILYMATTTAIPRWSVICDFVHDPHQKSEAKFLEHFSDLTELKEKKINNETMELTCELPWYQKNASLSWKWIPEVIETSSILNEAHWATSGGWLISQKTTNENVECDVLIARCSRFLIGTIYTKEFKKCFLDESNSDINSSIIQEASNSLPLLQHIILGTANNQLCHYLGALHLDAILMDTIFSEPDRIENVIKSAAMMESGYNILSLLLGAAFEVVKARPRRAAFYAPLLTFTINQYHGIWNALGYENYNALHAAPISGTVALGNLTVADNSNTKPFGGYPIILIIILRLASAIIARGSKEQEIQDLVDLLLMETHHNNHISSKNTLNMISLLKVVYPQWLAAKSGKLKIVQGKSVKPKQHSEHNLINNLKNSDKRLLNSQNHHRRQANNDGLEKESYQEDALRAACAWLDPKPMKDYPPLSEGIQNEISHAQDLDLRFEGLGLSDLRLWGIQFLFSALMEFFSCVLSLRLNPAGLHPNLDKILPITPNLLSSIYDIGLEKVCYQVLSTMMSQSTSQTMSGKLLNHSPLNALDKSVHFNSKAVCLELLTNTAIVAKKRSRLEVVMTLCSPEVLKILENDVVAAFKINDNASTGGRVRFVTAFVECIYTNLNLLGFKYRYNCSAAITKNNGTIEGNNDLRENEENIDNNNQLSLNSSEMYKNERLNRGNEIYGDNIVKFLSFLKQAILPVITNPSQQLLSQPERWHLASLLARLIGLFISGPLPLIAPPADALLTNPQNCPLTVRPYRAILQSDEMSTTPFASQSYTSRPTSFVYTEFTGMDSSLLQAYVSLLVEATKIGLESDNFAAKEASNFLVVATDSLDQLLRRDILYGGIMLPRDGYETLLTSGHFNDDRKQLESSVPDLLKQILSKDSVYSTSSAKKSRLATLSLVKPILKDVIVPILQINCESNGQRFLNSVQCPVQTQSPTQYIDEDIEDIRFFSVNRVVSALDVDLRKSALGILHSLSLREPEMVQSVLHASKRIRQTLQTSLTALTLRANNSTLHGYQCLDDSINNSNLTRFPGFSEREEDIVLAGLFSGGPPESDQVQEYLDPACKTFKDNCFHDINVSSTLEMGLSPGVYHPMTNGSWESSIRPWSKDLLNKNVEGHRELSVMAMIRALLVVDEETISNTNNEITKNSSLTSHKFGVEYQGVKSFILSDIFLPRTSILPYSSQSSLTINQRFLIKQNLIEKKIMTDLDVLRFKMILNDDKLHIMTNDMIKQLEMVYDKPQNHEMLVLKIWKVLTSKLCYQVLVIKPSIILSLPELISPCSILTKRQNKNSNELISNYKDIETWLSRWSTWGLLTLKVHIMDACDMLKLTCESLFINKDNESAISRGSQKKKTSF